MFSSIVDKAIAIPEPPKPVPSFSRSWLSTHREKLGDLPVGDLCLPYSHDAGTYRLDFGTIGGNENTVLTQTKSIFDQLGLGVRVFDIRPTLSDAPLSLLGTVVGAISTLQWYCGHWTLVEGMEVLNYRGGNCASLSEVILEVDRFTKDNPELVVLDLTHIKQLEFGTLFGSKEVELKHDDWLFLFSILSKIENLYTLQRSDGDKNRPLKDRHLNDFIGDNRAAVVVIVDYGDNPPDDLYQYGLWPKKTASGQPTFERDGTPVLHTQSPDEVKAALLDLESDPKINPNSVLSLAVKEQTKVFPSLLQTIAEKGDLTRQIAMDRIENPDLLTFCLAVTCQRYYNNRNISDKVIVYGGQLIMSPDVHREMQQAIDKGQSFPATNTSLGGDPWGHMHKSCAVFYKQNGLLKGRWCREGDDLHFKD